jgi:hypothetical protein
MLTESQVNELLHKVYGFFPNKENGGARFEWRIDGRILVQQVYKYKRLRKSETGRLEPTFSDQKASVALAHHLGLEPDDLLPALNGAFSKECLLLVFLVQHLRRATGLLGHRPLEFIVDNHLDFIGAIKSSPLGKSCCKVTDRHLTTINNFIATAQLTAVGVALKALVDGNNCPKLTGTSTSR